MAGGNNRSVRLWLRALVLIVFFLVLFYLGRPLYWKLSTTLQDVREHGPLKAAKQIGEDTKHAIAAAKSPMKPLLTKEKVTKKEESSKPKVDKKQGKDSKVSKSTARKLAQFETYKSTK